ncbi:MAG: hypothetical protein WC695_08680 [Candidatus Omnitrophota bacterium]
MGNIRDVLELSAITRYVAVLKAMPAIDHARVEEARNNIKEGKYFSEDIAYKTAEKMTGLLRDLDV